MHDSKNFVTFHINFRTLMHSILNSENLYSIPMKHRRGIILTKHPRINRKKVADNTVGHC